MTARITREGDYELFRDTDGKQVLELDGDQIKLVQSPRGKVIAHRHGDFQHDIHLDRGHYKFIDFDDDRHDPRLLLEREGDFRVVLFTEGLPGDGTDEVIARFSEEVVGLDEVEAYVNSLRSATVQGRNRLDATDPRQTVAHHLSSIDFPAEKAELLKHAHRRQAADDVVERLEQLENRNYSSRRDVVARLNDQEAVDEMGLKEASADELLEMIAAMEPAELHKLERHERQNDRRPEVLEAIERHLDR